MRKPSFNLEKELWKKGYLVIGIDEVGRGALAGPLVLGGVCFLRKKAKEILKWQIKDSKKITSLKRKKLSQAIKKHAYKWAVIKINERYINNHNIAKAFQKGVRDLIKKLKIENCKLKIYLLIDGFYVKYLKGVGLKNQRGIIKGDEKSISIASASIIAKVYRDNLMRKLAKKYPKYHWDKNKGYGTKEHIKALKLYGKTKHHRILFIRNII